MTFKNLSVLWIFVFVVACAERNIEDSHKDPSIKVSCEDPFTGTRSWNLEKLNQVDFYDDMTIIRPNKDEKIYYTSSVKCRVTKTNY